jgi:hypothetical protein
LRFAWDALRSLAVVDDNFLPYMSISTTADAPRSAKDYSAEDIDSLIVALPEKMFYPADAVDRLGPALFKLGAVVGLPPRDNTIIRYFITTGSALRSFVREKAGEFDPRLLTTIMTIPFAQFVWIVEFATESQWARGVVEARAVIDATASLTEAMPLWLFHGQAAALVFDRKTVGQITDGVGVLTLVPAGHTGFTRMERNLRATQAK